MNLNLISENHIKFSGKFSTGTVIIIDEKFIPLDVFDTSKKALGYFDDNDELIWLSNGVDDAGFWQPEGDCFTGFFCWNDDPVVVTFSGHAYNVDMDTGKLTFRQMVK